MSVHRFGRVQMLPTTRDAAWTFFSDPANLARITPPDMGFRLVSPVPPVVYPGLMVCYRVRPLLGIPVTWVTEITQVRPGEYFIDEQRMGPYRLWHHEHHFREVPGGVEMRDIVHYALPLGPLGAWLNALLVGPRIARIFDYRREVLERMFRPEPGGGGSTRSTDGEPPPIAAMR